MCGHVGIAGKLEWKDEATLKRLLVFDFFRGPDSTGLAAVRNNGEVKISKIASHPLDLFDMKKFQDALSGHQSSVFIGHNRAATRGVVNTVNAHPYQYDHIVGAHNGTLDKSSWVKLEEIIGEKTDVDSQAIFMAFAKVGVEETLKHLQGAWALVWYDMEKKTLNFLRNKERPFWYAYSKEFNKVLWASEYPMIRAAVDLSTQPYDLYTTEEGHSFWATMENWWYVFDLEELKAGATVRPKPRVKELKGKEAPVSTYVAGGNPFGRVGPHGTPTTSTTTSPSTSSNAGSETGDDMKGAVFQISGNNHKPFGPFLTESEFNKSFNGGCSWCGNVIDFDEPGLTVYVEQDKVLCPSCTGNTGSKGKIPTTRIYISPERIKEKTTRVA